MERKMTIADFSALVGTTSKTIYGKINNYGNLPVNEKLRTVKEKVKGREVTLIITDDDQIEYYKNLYGKDMVINGEYYETVTDINGNQPVNEIQEPVKVNNSKELLSEMFDKLNTVHNEYNERLQKVNDELVTYKSKTLLLEDKAGREGYYLNEINELKKVNDRNKLYINVLITVITILLLFITGFITYNYASNKTPEAASPEQVKVDTVETPGVEASKPEPKPQPKPVKARRK